MPRNIALSHRVTWGDCDAAGIVFYPNFFRMMDEAFQCLLRAQGFSQRSIQQSHGFLGTPLLEASASFRSPATCDDIVDIAATVAELTNKTFRVAYSAYVGDRVVFTGSELRAFVARDGAGRLSSQPIPDEFRQAFSVSR